MLSCAENSSAPAPFNQFDKTAIMSGRKIELRTETDRFGEITLPANAYWGAQTARSCKNGIKLSQLNFRFLEALLLLHKASALANVECGRLDAALGRTLGQTVDEISGGQWQDQFIIAPLQLASVYDIVANVREVLANRAGEILGARVGSYTVVQPQQQPGLGQTAQDDFAAALRIALLLLQKDLDFALRDLERLLRRKALEFDRLTRTGGADLQGSAVLRLALVFNGFGFDVGKVCKRISESSNNLLELNLNFCPGTASGGTANLAQLVVSKLSSYTGLSLRLPDDSAKASRSASDFLEFSSALRLLAVTLSRLAGELQNMATRSRQDALAIMLPSVHFGVAGVLEEETAKPVVTEFVSMAAFQVIGLDAANNLVGQSCQTEPQGMLALIAHNLLQAMELLQQTVVIFNKRCINGISASNVLAGGEQAIEPAVAVSPAV
jgi:aspartate ammonia-lyase